MLEMLGVNELLGTVGIIIGLVGAVAAGVFVVIGKKKTVDDTADMKTVTFMAAQITALESANNLITKDKEALQIRVDHLEELRKIDKLEHERETKRNSDDIIRLTELVTQQAAVQQFRDEAMAWLEAIGIATQTSPPDFPDHVNQT